MKRKKNDFELIVYPEQVKISPNCLTLFNRTNLPYSRKPKNIAFDETGQIIEKEITTKICSNKTSGFISDRAAGRLQSSIKTLFWLSDCFRKRGKKIQLECAGKITFITLTLSSEQFHSDQYIKSKMLNQFITELQARYPNLLYIWRSEKQINGNIHFHFLVNKFIKWEYIRKVWNRIQAKEGYIQLYQQKFKNLWFEEYLQTITKFSIDNISNYKRAYDKGVACGWSDPNSIDVRNVKKIKDVYSYISKYISKRAPKLDKADQNTIDLLKIDGRIYYCCSEINRLKHDSPYIDQKIISELDFLKSLYPDKIFRSEFFTQIRLSIEQIFNCGVYHIYTLFIYNLQNFKT